ncbi:MAG TPA: FtsQ-type POTRA domain-containing protein, partial [Rhizomicrobium sp.]|nr:FtsQ-type POTRA domain-containing protein [Rhizomicrobium sp.]
MRSVNVERKPRDNPRVRAVRKPARPLRDTPAKNSGRRGGEREGIVAGLTGRALRLFRRPVLLLSLGVVLFALIAALFASGVIGRTIHGVNDTIDAVIADAGFGISEIHLAGNNRVAPETILAALGMRPGESIFGAKLGQARNRIMALDWVASADVVRRYPDSIFVTIVEKRPFALWQSPGLGNGRGGVAIVERTGGIITTQGVENFARLPKLVGAGAPAAAADVIEAVMAHRAAAARVAAYEYVSQRRWNLILNDGVVVKLPETGWQKELNTLERLIVDAGILERDITE